MKFFVLLFLLIFQLNSLFADTSTFTRYQSSRIEFRGISTTYTPAYQYLESVTKIGDSGRLYLNGVGQIGESFWYNSAASARIYQLYYTQQINQNIAANIGRMYLYDPLAINHSAVHLDGATLKIRDLLLANLGLDLNYGNKIDIYNNVNKSTYFMAKLLPPVMENAAIYYVLDNAEDNQTSIVAGNYNLELLGIQHDGIIRKILSVDNTDIEYDLNFSYTLNPLYLNFEYRNQKPNIEENTIYSVYKFANWNAVSSKVVAGINNPSGANGSIGYEQIVLATDTLSIINTTLETPLPFGQNMGMYAELNDSNLDYAGYLNSIYLARNISDELRIKISLDQSFLIGIEDKQIVVKADYNSGSLINWQGRIDYDLNDTDQTIFSLGCRLDLLKD